MSNINYSKKRLILGFILSPLIGVFICQFFVISEYLFSIMDKGLNRVLISLLLGISPLLLIYTVLFFVSIPIFLLIKIRTPWTLKICIYSAYFSVFITSIIFFPFGGPVTSDASLYFLNLNFITGAFIGTLIYGVAFWFIVVWRPKE